MGGHSVISKSMHHKTKDLCWCFGALSLAVLFMGCQQKPSDGLNRFPVTGSVLVDGEPATGVVVRLFRDGQPGATNADTPLAVTRQDGTFAMSTNGDGDGAVPGNYRVTFTWKESNSPTSKDRLGGRYTGLKESKVDVEVRSEPTQLPPFELQSAATPSPPRSAAVSRGKRGHSNAGLPPIPPKAL